MSKKQVFSICVGVHQNALVCIQVLVEFIEASVMDGLMVDILIMNHDC